MSSYPNYGTTQDEPGYQQPQEPTQTAGQGAMAPVGEQSERPSAVPNIDVIDNADEIWVVMDLPGFTEEEIELRGDDRALVVTAERMTDVEEGRNVLLRERPTRVQRTIPLTAPVNVDEADAAYENGVCKVTLPKIAAERFVDIEVHPP
jgi:HSP20 family protein